MPTRTLLIAFLMTLATQAGAEALGCKAKNVSAIKSDGIENDSQDSVFVKNNLSSEYTLLDDGQKMILIKEFDGRRFKTNDKRVKKHSRARKFTCLQSMTLLRLFEYFKC